MLGILLLLVHKPQMTEWLSLSGWNFQEPMRGSRNESSHFLLLQSMRDTSSIHSLVCSSGNGGEFLTIHGFVVAKIQADDSSASKNSHVTTEAADVNIPVRCCTGSGMLWRGELRAL